MPLANGADDMKLGEQQVIFLAQGQYRIWPPATGSQPTISALSSAGTVTISWAETENAELYELRRNGTLISTQESRVYSDSGLEWGSTYSYTVTPIVFGIPGDESPASANALIPKGSVGSLSASSRTYTNVTVSWAAVPGATHYKVYKNGVAFSTQTSLSRSVSVTADTTTDIYVQPIRNGVVGNNSATYEYYSGRAEQRDQGSKSGMIFYPDRIDSWRPVDAWAWLSGWAAQGYYTAAYGNYKGVFYYGTNGIRGSLRTKLGGGDLGQARQLRGSCTKIELYLYKKPNTGVYGSVNVDIRKSNSTASGGEPFGQDPITRTSSVNGTGKWVTIRDSHGQALGDGDSKSLMIRNDGPADYAQFNNGRLRVSWSWNYVTVTAKANTWSLA